MRPTNPFGLAVVSAAIALALVVVPSATAEPTAFCDVDETPCVSENQVQTLHWVAYETTLLSSLGSISCERLLAWSVLPLANPMIAHTTESVISNCKGPNGVGCTVTEEQAPTFVVLREGTNLGRVTPSGGIVNYQCAGVISCTYGGSPIGHVAGSNELQMGPELQAFDEPLERISGLLCPADATIDYLYMALDHFWITS